MDPRPVRKAEKDIAMADYSYLKLSRKKYEALLRQRILTPGTFAVAHANKNSAMKVVKTGADIPQKEMCELEKD